MGLMRARAPTRMGTDVRLPARIPCHHGRPTCRVWPEVLVVTILMPVVSGCTTTAGGCAPLVLDDVVSEQLDQWWNGLEFTRVVPCGSGSLHVAEVTLDQPAGKPRLTFVVSADRTVFLMSQSRAVREFSQVPEGARRLSRSVDGALVTGFRDRRWRWPRAALSAMGGRIGDVRVPGERRLRASVGIVFDPHRRVATPPLVPGPPLPRGMTPFSAGVAASQCRTTAPRRPSPSTAS